MKKLLSTKNIPKNNLSKLAETEEIMKKTFLKKMMFGQYAVNKVKFTASTPNKNPFFLNKILKI